MLDEFFGTHIERLQAEYAAALGDASIDGVIIASGAPLLRFEDDDTVPFRVNPRYRQWVPIGEHTHSFLVVQPGRRPHLICHLPADYWHTVPAPPSSVDSTSMAPISIASRAISPPLGVREETTITGRGK